MADPKSDGVRAKVRVELGERGYDILIGEGLVARAGTGRQAPLLRAQGRPRGVSVDAKTTTTTQHAASHHIQYANESIETQSGTKGNSRTRHYTTATHQTP